MYSRNRGASRDAKVLNFPPREGAATLPSDASPELRYAASRMEEREFGELAVGGASEGGEIDTTIYRWIEDANGARWEIQPAQVLEGDAQSFLRIFAPDAVSGSRPVSCVRSLEQLLVHERRFVPKCPAQNLVPLRNAYLVIEPTGTIRVIKPDRQFGVDYVIQADLDMSKVDEAGVYTPTQHANEGAFGNYINTSLSDEAVRDYAQECLSTVLLTRCYEKAIWLFGEGENGKSVMLHLLRRLAPRNTAAIKLSRLGRDQFGTASLNGMRLALVPEMPSRLEREMQTILKGLISRDPTPCERKGRNEFTFTPSAVWVFATNHHPDMSDHEHGFWRKVETIPFTNRVDPAKKVLDLHAVISETAKEVGSFIDGVLIGASRLSQNGRWRTQEEKPEAIRKLAQAQRRETDTVSAWLHDVELRFEASVLTSKQAIYHEYREHVEISGKRAVADSKFWGRMKEQFRDQGLDTEGEQRTIQGKRRRCVSLLLHGVRPDFGAIGKSGPVADQAEQLGPDIFCG